MELKQVTEALSSLSQETRLQVFKLLIEYGRDGTEPSKLAEELGIPANTLSFHLAHMSKARLVSSKKNGRSITYYANNRLVEDLIDFLKSHCCVRQTAKPKKTNCYERKC